MNASNLLNWISLSLIQASNAITPLVLFPFALAKIGAEAYAALVTTEVVTIFITVLVIYSFEIDGQAKIARLKQESKSQLVSEIFSQILYARLSIFTIAFTVVIPIAWIVIDTQSALLLTIWLGVPLSIALQPNWLFQSLEKNSGVAVIAVASRLACLGIVVSCVNDSRDVILIPTIISICYVVGSLLSLIYLRVAFNVSLRPVKFSEVWRLLVDGRHVFVGNFCVALYRESNVLILGLIGASASAISSYSIAEKIIKGLQTSIRPLNQLFFPKALRLLADQCAPNIQTMKILWKLLYPQLMALSLLIVFVLFGWGFGISDEFKVKYLLNHNDVELLIALMLPAIFFGVSNFMLGTAGLNFLGIQRYLMGSIITVGVSNVVICIFLASQFGSVGAGACFVISEAFLLFLIILKYIKHNKEKKRIK